MSRIKISIPRNTFQQHINLSVLQAALAEAFPTFEPVIQVYWDVDTVASGVVEANDGIPERALMQAIAAHSVAADQTDIGLDMAEQARQGEIRLLLRALRARLETIEARLDALEG